MYRDWFNRVLNNNIKAAFGESPNNLSGVMGVALYHVRMNRLKKEAVYINKSKISAHPTSAWLTDLDNTPLAWVNNNIPNLGEKEFKTAYVWVEKCNQFKKCLASAMLVWDHHKGVTKFTTEQEERILALKRPESGENFLCLVKHCDTFRKRLMTTLSPADALKF
jgi:hypothetical protein